MRWKGETVEQEIKRLSQWHLFFCLFPRQMNDGSWVWLEKVQRRAYYCGLYGDNYVYEYQITVEPENDPYFVEDPPTT